MLRFPRKPDAIFCQLIHEAITHAVRQLTRNTTPILRRRVLEGLMPESARVLSTAQVIQQLSILQDACAVPKLYQPTGYHWLLLYETVQSYCAHFNEDPSGALSTHHGIEHIDFGRLANLYFWDSPFRETALRHPLLHQREVWSETAKVFGVTTGLKPHRDELVLHPCEPELVRQFDASDMLTLSPGSKSYPSFLDTDASHRSNAIV